MTKTRFYQLTTLGLLCINLLLAGFFLFRHGPPSDVKNRPKKMIIKRLHFNDEQIAKYEVLIDAHRKDIRKLNDDMMQLKQDLYQQLIRDEAKNKDVMLQKLSATHLRMEEVHFEHFMDIKNLCTPEQSEAYEMLVKDIAKIFAPRMHR